MDTVQQRKRLELIAPQTVRTLNRALLYTVLVLGSIGTCFPFLWMIITSFKTYAEAIASPPTLFPKDWGVRAPVLGQMLRSYPHLLLIFVAWMALGILVARKIKDKVIAGIYVLAHLALFFILGNLGWLGHNRLFDLWQATMARAGITLEPLSQNYVAAWGRAPFAAYFKNSIIVSILTPLLIVVTSAPAAYAFARLRFPGKDVIFLLYLATMMIPPEVLLIPNFHHLRAGLEEHLPCAHCSFHGQRGLDLFPTTVLSHHSQRSVRCLGHRRLRAHALLALHCPAPFPASDRQHGDVQFPGSLERPDLAAPGD